MAWLLENLCNTHVQCNNQFLINVFKKYMWLFVNMFCYMASDFTGPQKLLDIFPILRLLQ